MRDRNEVDLKGSEAGEKLGGAEGGETVIRIFNKRKNILESAKMRLMNFALGGHEP